jgi:hypothetical protein
MSDQCTNNRLENTLVKLIDLSIVSLNGSTGLITSPPDPKTGRYTIQWETASEAVRCTYPNGIRIKPRNALVMAKLHSGTTLVPTAIFDDQWFVDCYRFGLYSEHCEGNLRGIYCKSYNGWTAWFDFFVFCLCCNLRSDQTWKGIISIAKVVLHRPVGNDSAAKLDSPDKTSMFQQTLQRYQVHFEVLESLFSGFFAESGGDIDFSKLQAWLEGQPQVTLFNSPDYNMTEIDASLLFENVGGIDLWAALYDTLKCTVDMNCGNSGCHNKGIHACGACKVYRYCSGDCQKQDWAHQHKAKCKQLCSAMCKLQPMGEVSRYINAELVKCYEIQRNKNHKKTVAVATSLLTYATEQFGAEDIPGVDFCSRGDEYVTKIKMDLDLAKINTLIGGSLIHMGGLENVILSYPYLVKAKQLITKWIILLNQGNNAEFVNLCHLMYQATELNHLYLIVCTKTDSLGHGPEYIVDTWELWSSLGSKSLKWDLSLDYAFILVGICNITTEVAQVVMESNKLILLAKSMIEYAETEIVKYAGIHNDRYRDCLHVHTIVMLSLPPKDVVLQKLMAKGEAVLRLSETFDGPISAFTGTAHFIQAQVYDRCCGAAFENDLSKNHSPYNADRKNLPVYAKKGIMHAEKALSIFNQLIDDNYSPNIQSCRVVFSCLHIWLLN